MGRLPKNLASPEVILVVLGVAMFGTLLVSAQWAPHSQKLVQEVVTVPPQSHYWPQTTSPSLTQGKAANIIIDGKVTEVDGREFTFLALSKIDYERWKSGDAYQSFVEEPAKAIYEFSFSVSLIDFKKDLKLVSVNPSHAEAELNVAYDVNVSWSERTYVPGFDDPAIRGALILIAFVFLLAGAVTRVKKQALPR